MIYRDSLLNKPFCFFSRNLSIFRNFTTFSKIVKMSLGLNPKDDHFTVFMGKNLYFVGHTILAWDT